MKRPKLLALLSSSAVGAAMVIGYIAHRRGVLHGSVAVRTVDIDALFATRGRPAPSEIEGGGGRTQLVRFPLDEGTVAKMFPQLRSSWNEYDPQALYRYRGRIRYEMKWPEHPRGRYVACTNSLGLRGEREVALEHPNLRVLITGDSHTDGVCDAEDTYVARLERRLLERDPGRTVETLNAAVGGYGFYNYLGALERYLPLVPDVFVVGVYGGNDFSDVLLLHHYFGGTAFPTRSAKSQAALALGMELDSAAMSQCLASVTYFVDRPEQAEIAEQAAGDVTDEIVRLCRSNGVAPLIVYIPPACSIAHERERRGEGYAALSKALALESADWELLDRMADRYLEHARSAGATVLDLRPDFARAQVALYWDADLHINLVAHERIASALAPIVDGLMPANRRALPTQDISAIERPNPVEGVGGRVGERVRLRRRPFELPSMSREAVEARFSLRTDQEYDPVCLFRYRANLGSGDPRATLRTNALGLLGEHEPDPARESLLLLGDETVFSPGDAGPAVGALLESRLPKLNCLDACTDGYGALAYLGVLERFAGWKLRSVVLVLDAGSDFDDAGSIDVKSERRSGEPTGSEFARRGLDAAASLQEAAGRIRASTRATSSVVAGVDATCKRVGARLLVVVLPAPNDRRVSDVGDALDAAGAAFAAEGAARGIDAAALVQLQRRADALMVTLEEQGIAVIDFGNSHAASTEPLIDPNTLRLNPLGRRTLADVIAGALREPR